MSLLRSLLCLWALVLAGVAHAQAPAGPAEGDAPLPVPPVVAPAAGPEVPAGPGSTSPQYRVGPGDTLQVVVYGEPGLSGPFPVSDAGDLDFPLLGRVPVAGLNAGEVTELLRGRLSPGFLLNPNVSVWLAAYRSQPVQVLGDVARPGVYYLRGPTTVLQILSEAGGVSRAGVNEIRVTRGGEGGTVTLLAYDLLLSQRSPDLPLQAGDIVFVPQSLVAVMGQVARPGEIAWRDGLTVSGSIAAAGGANPVADLGRVVVLRGDVRMRVNVRRILRGRAADVPLEPGDRVYVRESAL